MAIHNDMFMGYELSGLLTGSGKTQSEQSIVEPGFQKHKQILTGDTFPCTRFFVKITELSLEQSVGVFCLDRKSTRLNSSHVAISYAVFCLKKKKVWVSWRRTIYG